MPALRNIRCKMELNHKHITPQVEGEERGGEGGLKKFKMLWDACGLRRVFFKWN